MAARSTVKHGKATKKSIRPRKPAPKKPTAKRRTLAEVFANIIGQAKGLPPDASTNHDYYLYGAPKQK